MHTQEGTPNFMTENLSTGVLDEAGAQQDTGADPPAAEAAKAISAIVTEAATSVTSISNPDWNGTGTCPGASRGPQNASPCSSFPALLPGATAAPQGPI